MTNLIIGLLAGAVISGLIYRKSLATSEATSEVRRHMLQKANDKLYVLQRIGQQQEEWR